MDSFLAKFFPCLAINGRSLFLYGAFFLIFNLYLWQVFPDIYWFDSGEFAFHSFYLGIPHPTGYPTYIQLLKLFSLFPVGSPYFLINFASAFFGFLALIFLYRIVFALTRETFPALSAVTIFAFSATFLSKVQVAEVYTLQVLITLWVIYLFFDWMDTGDRRKMLMVSFLLGLGFSNHMITLFLLIAAGAFYLILNRDIKGSVKTVFLCAPFFFVPLLSYVFIYVRSDLPAPMNFTKNFEVNLKTFDGWYWLLTGKLHRAEMLPADFFAYIKEAGFFAYLLCRDFLILPALLGIMGMTSQFIADRRKFAFLFALFFTVTAFSLYYRIPDNYDYYTVSFAIFAIWVGLGINRLLAFLKLRSKALEGIAYVSIGVFCLVSIANPILYLDRSDKEYPIEYAHRVFAGLPREAIISTIHTGYYPLRLFQNLAETRKDVEIFDYGVFYLKLRQELENIYDVKNENFPRLVNLKLRESLSRHLEREILRRPVFFSRDEAFLYNRFIRTKIAEGMYRVNLKPPPQVLKALPEGVSPLSLTFGDELQLVGVSMMPATLMEGEPFYVNFYWKPLRPIEKELIGLMILSQVGVEDICLIEFTLGAELLPPSQWKPGEVIKDLFQFSLGKNMREGNYSVFLALFEKNYFYHTPFKKLKFNLAPIGTVKIYENPKLAHYWDKK